MACKIKYNFIIFFLFFGTTVYGGDMPYIFFHSEDIIKVKEAIQKNLAEINPYTDQLRKYADVVKNTGPWSVTYFPAKALGGNPHDYYSEGPYWWPDPNNPNGPYIRKDGLRNPERYMAHKESLIKVYEAVFILSMAGYFFEEPEYSQKAVEIIRIWFLNEDTKMNPNMNYAQAIPNKSPGRGVGIIDTHRYTKLMEALVLLVNSGYLVGEDLRQLQKWFSDYVDWLTTSKNGLDEKQRDNNHASWWAAQVAAYATFAGDNDSRNMIWEYVREHIISRQIESDGNFPEEEARTRSYDYTIFNLDALTLLATMADKDGVDLWTYTNKNRGNLNKSVAYFFPFIADPDNWSKEQITSIRKREPIFLGLVVLKYENDSYYKVYNNLQYPRKKININGSVDSFRLLLNYIMIINNQKLKNE